MKAVVTGCAGFVGSHLTEALLAGGLRVTGIDSFTDYYRPQAKRQNLEQALRHGDFELLEADILRLAEFPETDYLFHLAAQPGVRASWGTSFEVYVRNNVLATQKLLEYYKDRRLARFVYASSSSVYGDCPDLPMREDSLLKPVSPYGVTKLAAENLCYLYYKNYGLPAVSLRYFTVYGPRQRPDMAINKMVGAVFAGDEITVFGDGTQTRDFTYVEDAVEATVIAAQKGPPGEVFNTGGGSRITVNELVGKIESIAGRKARVRNTEEQKGDVRDTLADISKAGQILNWQPEVGIDRGLERYIAWFHSTAQTQ
ncbi:MAG: GDP-mannose 4,6-dehydratase [Dehalococcoidia bacterium]